METVALAFGAVVGAFSCITARETFKVHQVRNRGVRTDGWVLHIRTDTDGDGDLQHFPVVRFELPDGTTVEAESATGMPHSCPLDPGDWVEVAYHPRRPEEIVIIGFDGPANPWVYGGITLFLAAFSALLLRDGTAAP